jgi:hypothetical protein
MMRLVADTPRLETLLALIERIAVDDYDVTLSARDNFVRSVSPLLEASGFDHCAIVAICEDRTLTFQEILELEHSTISGAELLANKIAAVPFRGSLPRRLKRLHDFSLHYMLHIPKTGGQSITNNLFDHDYPVWDIDPNAHVDFVYAELPRLRRRLLAKRLLLVHSHIFWTHIQNSFVITPNDLAFTLIRNPRAIHLSNANYIYEHITKGVGEPAEKIVDKTWDDYGQYVDKDSKAKTLIAILNSQEYSSVYANLVTKYLFGEFQPDIDDLEPLSEIVCEQLTVVRTEHISEFLGRQYGIEHPQVFNAAPGMAYDKQAVLDAVDWMTLSFLDDAVYRYIDHSTFQKRSTTSFG